MGYAARLISGIELKYAIKTSNYEKSGRCSYLKISAKIRLSGLA